jgi:hypothetical protein
MNYIDLQGGPGGREKEIQFVTAVWAGEDGGRVSHLCEDALWCVVSGGRFCPHCTTAPMNIALRCCTLRNGKRALFHFADFGMLMWR